MLNRSPARGGRALRRLGTLAILLGIAVLGLALFPGGAPTIALAPAQKAIGAKAPIEISIDDVSRVEGVAVELVQGSDVHAVARESYAPRPFWKFWAAKRPAKLSVDVGRGSVRGLRQGAATIRVTAERAGSMIRRPAPAVAEIEQQVRLAPPAIALLSIQHYVAQGGCEAVVYRLGEGSVRDGVVAGDRFFPGFPLGGADPNERFALFAVPYDRGSAEDVRLIAEDDAGNRAERAFVDQWKARPVKEDTIRVDDKFLGRVVPEILAQSPEVADRGSLVENYLAINRDLRRQNAQTLVDLAAKSEPRFLWNQPFQPMRNAAVKAAFADRRTYVYGERPIDQQDHLGFDLASVERDAIQASNRGKVVLARYFGIYGNAVVLDHGYGLMSLYGHLSSIAVSEGQSVERGRELGRSGQTGLAGGDHLHFTFLLQGLPVHPAEWWDAHWIEDRVARKLGPALGFAPAP